jgi:predicted adenylyl cyclase CyaB
MSWIVDIALDPPASDRQGAPVQNIEVKTPLHDRANIEARLQALGARQMWTRRQVDTFFVVTAGWLKLREAEGRPPEMISYERSTVNSGPRSSQYDVIVLQDPTAWKRLLGRVLPVETVVEKERTLWIYEHTRIHLDKVKDLGDFLELETVVEGLSLDEARAENHRVLSALALERGEFLALPYKDLIARKGT